MSTLPARSVAAQNVALGHDTLAKLLSTLVVVHAATPPAGLVDAVTQPCKSTATHSDADAHATPTRASPPSMWVIVHAPAPPVGSEEVRPFPALSTAAQNEPEAHDTPTREAGLPRLSVALSRCVVLHVAAPPVGLVESTTSPW